MMVMNNKKAARWPVYVVVMLFVVVTVAFVIEFMAASSVDDEIAANTDDYAERVATLLADADPARGEMLIAQMDCSACHISAARVGIAPAFEGIAIRADSRRPPLTAAEYIYESIINPTAYVVDGFAGSMPQNYGVRLSDEQLGDIMAYLLTLD